METEERIQKTLNSIEQDKTCFIIAHRISSVKDADFILVMHDGKIIERGKHEELLLKEVTIPTSFKTNMGTLIFS